MPMVILGIGSAVASGVGSILGGKAQAAQIRAQNEQAMRNWVSSNTQKTFNNARSQFEATLAFEQQLKRNKAISDEAYRYQAEATNVLKENYNKASKDMANTLASNKASLNNAVNARGISSNSGMFGMLATMQALDALQKAKETKNAFELEVNNINKQFKGMLNQQTANVFLPNLQLYDEAPILGDAGAAEAGGMISGLVQIGGAVAAAGMSGMGPKSTTTTGTKSTTNSFGTNLNNAPKGYTYNSSASQTTFSRTPFKLGLY